MFENQQTIVNSLLQENKDFSRLYNKHCELKDKINLANQGKAAMDDLILEQLKKQKLSIKDKMADMIYHYEHGH